MLLKKLKTLGMVMLLSFTVSGTAYAASIETPTVTLGVLVAASIYINQASSTLSISSGSASIKGYAQKTPAGDSIQLISTLQYYSSGSWIAKQSWSVYTTSSSANISETYQVPRGTYRVATSYIISGGSGSESGIVYSDTVTY
jgi:hypothetical protein